jgi:HK97 family phage major capsid protein
MREKASELRAQRAKLLDEAREIVERSEKENRVMTKDEEARHVAICGDFAHRDKFPGEANQLAQRISQIERQIAVDNMGDETPERRSRPLPHEDPANTGDGKHRWSLMKAVRQMASKGLEPLDGLEKEVSAEISHRTDKTPQGFFMPYRTTRRTYRDWDREKRALDSNQGAGSVPTVLDRDWIELLRNKMQVMAAGAREILDLKGKFAIPRQNAAATAYWVAESAAPTGTNQTLDQVLFTPHTIGAFTDISRRFFELTILDSGEEFVEEDLTAILGRGVDLAALNGPGNSFTPLGILQNTGITATRTVSLGTNGAAPTWSAVVELYTIVSRGNAADLGEFVYLGNGDVEGTLATTAKIGSTFPYFILDDNRRIYAKRFLATQQLPNNLTKGSGTSLSPIIGGIWNQLVLAYWSGVDILVDPYTGSSTGTVRIVALQDMDIQARHNEAFSVIVDMVSNQTQ